MFEWCTCFTKAETIEQLQGGLISSRIDLRSRKNYPKRNEIICKGGFRTLNEAMDWASDSLDDHCKIAGLWPQTMQEYREFFTLQVENVHGISQFAYQPTSWKESSIRKHYPAANVTFVQ